MDMDMRTDIDAASRKAAVIDKVKRAALLRLSGRFKAQSSAPISGKIITPI